MGNSYGVVANVLDTDIELSGFELRSFAVTYAPLGKE